MTCLECCNFTFHAYGKPKVKYIYLIYFLVSRKEKGNQKRNSKYQIYIYICLDIVIKYHTYTMKAYIYIHIFLVFQIKTFGWCLFGAEGLHKSIWVQHCITLLQNPRWYMGLEETGGLNEKTLYW